MTRVVLLAGLVSVMALTAAPSSATTVGVGPNGHWLTIDGESAVLIGDSVTQGWMETGTNFDQIAYLDALSQRGVNVLLMWSFIAVVSQTSDSRIGYDAPEIWPWQRPNGQFDLNQLNEAYFNRLRSFVQAADERGIVVVITVHDGWTKTRFSGHPFNQANGGPLTANSQYVELANYGQEMPTTFNPSWSRQQQHQYYLERFCNRLIEATGDLSNVIYEIFNEGEFYNQTNHRAFQVHFLDFFKSRTPRLTMINDDHVGGQNFRSEVNADIISAHFPSWNNSTNASNTFGPFASDFLDSPVKPFIFSETVPEYEGTPNGSAGSAPAPKVVQNGLDGAFAFANASGTTVPDSVGNHTGSVTGDFAWNNGALELNNGSSGVGYASIPRQGSMTGDWTVDLWFEAAGNGQNGAGRVFSAATEIGGTGPEFFFRSGKVAMRINNTNATWLQPRTGTRSNSGPPDHWALPTQAIAFNTLYHVVVTHDISSKTVKMYHAPASSNNLTLVFDGDYTGQYAISASDIRLSHSHEDGSPRWLEGSYHQLLLYDRVLLAAEAESNHDDGADSLGEESTGGSSSAPPDALLRVMWGTALGGAGITIQNDTSFGFDPNTNIASHSDSRNGLYDTLGHLARFMNQDVADLSNMVPQGNLSSSGIALADAGREYVVYSQSGANFSLDLSGPSNTYTARFYDPRIGVFGASSQVVGGGTENFTKPSNSDWVLHVVDSSQTGQVPENTDTVFDINGNGADDLAILRSTGAGGPFLIQLSDASTGGNLGELSFLNNTWIGMQVVSVPGVTPAGGAGIGVAAVRNDGLPLIQVKDPSNGNVVSNVYPMSAAWEMLDVKTIANPGGTTSIATLAERKSDKLMIVQVRNGATNAHVTDVFPLGLGWTAQQLEITDIAGQTGLAVLSTRDSDGLTIVQVRNLQDGSTVRNIYPLGLGWSPVEMQRTNDIDGNNADEIAVRMTRDTDGLEVIQIRDSLTSNLVGNVFPIGAGGNGWTSKSFAPVNNNGVTALVVLSTRDSDGAILAQVKSATTNAVIKNVWFIPPPWQFELGFEVMSDFSGNNVSEIAVETTNSLTQQRMVQIRDAISGAVLRNVWVN